MTLVLIGISYNTSKSNLMCAVQNLAYGSEKSSEALNITNRGLEKEIIEVFKIYDRYWNKKNIEKWSELFTNDVKVVVKRGIRINSKKDLIRIHKKVMEGFSQIDQNMNHEIKVEEIEILSKNFILVSAAWDWPEFKPGPGARAISDFNGVSTVILQKIGDSWLIHAMHSTVREEKFNPRNILFQEK